MDIPAYEDLLKQIKINLWLAGIPYGETKIYMRFYVVTSLLTFMISSEIAFFFAKVSSENILELTQLAPCICIGALSILKFVAVALKRRKILKLTENLSKLYKNILDDPRKKNLLRQNLVLVNFLMKYFFILNAVLIFVYNFSTVIIMAYHYIARDEMVFLLPYAVLLPFSMDSWLPWTFVYFYSIICGFICVLFYTTADGLYFVLTSHVCSNFSIISDTIERLDVTCVDRLGEIIKNHQYILSLGKDLEDIFTVPNLFNVLVGSLEICALGFNLTTGSWEQIPGCVLFLLSVLLQILMMSVFGENIIRESIKIGDAAFLCNWYEMDQKYKKMILIIIIRSQIPQRLTAYKFSTISYSSFTKIISTSWSYFTILRTVYTPSEISHN